MKTKTIIHFKRLLRFSGLFNIILAFPFMIPHLYEHYLQLYNTINTYLMLGGNNITIPSDPFHILFIHTAGIDLVLIGIFVLLASINPLGKLERLIVLINGIGRILFFFITGYYFITKNLIEIFAIIGVIDLFITSFFIYYLYKTKNYSVI